MRRPIRKQIVSQSQRGGLEVAAGRRRGLQHLNMLIGMISSVEEEKKQMTNGSAADLQCLHKLKNQIACSYFLSSAVTLL